MRLPLTGGLLLLFIFGELRLLALKFAFNCAADELSHTSWAHQRFNPFPKNVRKSDICGAKVEWWASHVRTLCPSARSVNLP